MQYTIQAVSPETRNYDTKFGTMTSYKIKLNEFDGIVELSQKATTPAPTVGQPLTGTIDMSGQFGPKFKKEFNQGGGFPQAASSTTSSSPQSGGTTTPGRFQSDPFTMYLSYAKDLAVALVGTKEGYTDEKFNELVEAVSTGGHVLYEGRPGAKTKSEDKPKDNLPDESLIDTSTIATLFNDDDTRPQQIDVKDIPF